MKRREFLGATAALLTYASLPGRAFANTKVSVGYTTVADAAYLFSAIEEGYFNERGLDVEARFIPLNPSLPPAVQSGSLTIALETPSVFLQAVDGGLDHVIIAGLAQLTKGTTGAGFVVSEASGIKTAQDCVGKTIGAPGLGALLHVAFRKWLRQNGVDDTKVKFVEAAFPQHNDLLRGGSIDGVVTVDPFMGRITSSGNGRLMSHYLSELPEGMPTMVFAARRDWAEKNPDQVKAFQQAIAQSAEFVTEPANDKAVREQLGKYIKLPPPVLATMEINPPSPSITTEQLNHWVETMEQQDMLKNKLDLSKLIIS
ncbi:ABC transporter substrate-binding protein [Pusillimonas sp.]|uniref:ABC transporter substrate-binding protein n=1 Tax=Pusillimonas sp. TaxID=3040095 RepID=UPI0037CBE8FE